MNVQVSLCICAHVRSVGKGGGCGEVGRCISAWVCMYACMCMYAEASGKHWISLSISSNHPPPLKVFFYFYVHSLLLQRTAVQFPAPTIGSSENL